ncbi:MAG: TIGR00282 family metallophosphoesterase [Armatimonadota bacterium]
MLRILMLGDVVGRPGRTAVSRHLPRLIEEHQPEIVIANGENAAGGLGINKGTAVPLFDAGVNVITLGNHVWTQQGMNELLGSEPRIIRPANLPPGLPGRGFGVFKTKDGNKIGVMNLLGRTFMEPVDDPFRATDAIVREIQRETPVIVVDIHAEATSEKAAIAWYLDGRVSAVLGTHTHIPTCDERVLPGGTAFLTDIGMVGPRDSILGMKVDVVVERFRTQVKQKFEVASGPAILSGVIIDVDNQTGRASSISRVSVIED